MRDAITEEWFSPASVQVRQDPNVPQAFDPAELVALSGAPRNSQLLVTFTGMFIRLDVVHPAVLNMCRELSYDMNLGKWVVYNTTLYFQPAFRRRGIGARSIALQARAALQLDIGYLATYAVGTLETASNPQQEDIRSGYLAWPRLGFDADIPGELLPLLRGELSAARRLVELMGSAEGREWWSKNGSDISTRFDLTPRSPSWRTLERYTLERNIRV